MSSRSAEVRRRIPQQQRGRRRVAAFLQAAASVIAEMGYERATMSAIAERADSCIGSLYQFFPHKESVVEALRAEYIGEVENRWAVLARDAKVLTADGLVCRLVSLQIELAQAHPAFVALWDAPPTLRTAQRRELIRERIARVLLARKPRMSKAKALRVAAVVQQIVKGLLMLYARADREEKGAVAEEFRAVLRGYLAPRLDGNGSNLLRAAGTSKPVEMRRGPAGKQKGLRVLST